MKKIKTFEDACKSKGIDPAVLPDVSLIPAEYQAVVIAQYKLSVVAAAINDGWKPDYTDYSQPKYFPWFEVNADEENRSGSGLSFHVTVGWDAGTTAGVRLCFKERDTATYVGKQFIKLYEELYLLGK